ncbi:HAD family hydrolase [Cryptosporangium sp. NPDC048952]|uniref:HAD family hydrolase n=1 Tax=Cryptosporangium sp. NPDC048952 TaxID=3363961 RepID=UPI0037156E2F
MTLTAALFDLDGTLFDHHGSAVAGLRTWLGRSLTDELVDLWFAAEAEHYQAWLDGTVTHAEQRRRRLRAFLPALGTPVPATDAELDTLYADGYLAAYRQAWCGYDDEVATLTALRDAGLRTGVLTNGTAAQQNAKVRALGLAHLLDVVVSADELGAAKPDPRAFHEACRRLGSEPEETVYVGDDHVVDVLGAQAAGLRAVHIVRTPGATATDGQILTLHDLPAYLDQRPVKPSQ